MIYLLSVLAIMLVLFLYCACKVSSRCSRLEEMEEKNNEFRTRI